MSATSRLLTDDPLWIAAPVTWRDACFSLPATRALAEIHPVRLLCPKAHANFWNAAGLAEVHEYEASSKPRALAQELPSIDQCLLWEDGLAAQAIAAANVRSRLGLPAGSLSKRLTQPLTLTQKPGPPTHRIQLFLEVATQLGAGSFESMHFAPLASPVPREPGSLLISPDSDFGTHYTWPADRWIELLAALPLTPELVRIHGTGPIAKELATATPFQVIDDLPIAQFAAFERCLAADSSLAHLAAAYGATCAVLFGPGDPEMSRPLGKQHLAIRRKVECSPCGLDSCIMDLRCQLDLDADRVSTAIKAFMAD